MRTLQKDETPSRPADERERIAEALLESISPDEAAAEFTPEQIAEIERRGRELDEGRATSIPRDEALKKIREWRKPGCEPDRK